MTYKNSLNLKSDEAHRLAHELSARTGESMTKAVVIALQERLERMDRAKTSRLERLLAIGRDCAAHMTEEERSVDHGELLYNEMGLPRDC
jgi:antitoxin VapB